MFKITNQYNSIYFPLGVMDCWSGVQYSYRVDANGWEDSEDEESP